MMKSISSTALVLFTCGAMVTSGRAWGQVPSIEALGTLPGNLTPIPTGVSGDGQKVCGFLSTSGTVTTAFVRSSSGVYQTFTGLPGAVSISTNVLISRDGNYMAGTSVLSVGTIGRATRWNSSGVAQGLGAQDTTAYSTALGISADGSTIMGTYFPGGNATYRWNSNGGTGGTITNIGIPTTPTGCSFVTGDAMAPSGNTISGFGSYASRNKLVRWVNGSGFQFVGTLASQLATHPSSARGWGISPDGDTIVGESTDIDGSTRAFVWKSGWSAPARVGSLGVGSQALATTNNGTVIIGIYTPALNASPKAFIAPASNGGAQVDLATYLASRGTNMSGWALSFASGMSTDGSIIIGSGTLNGVQQGFIINLNAAGSTRCSRADVASIGGALTPDNRLSVDDLIAYLGAFFGGNTAVADIATVGGAASPDTQITADDLISFLQAFFVGCP